jgi:Flp pilus assembly protein TadG
MSDRFSLKKSKGSVTVVVAAGMLVLLAIAAFAVDFGNVFVSRNELQNSADAGALAGAARLASEPAVISWDPAKELAVATAEKNKTGAGITPTILAQSGYWNASHYQQFKELKSPSITPQSNDYPAVQVVSSRLAQRGNAVPAYFAKFLGISSFDLNATAVALISGPGFLDQRDLFVFAMSKCLYDKYWDYTRTPPGPLLTPGGVPYEFQIPSDEMSACLKNDTAWTPLGLSNNTANVRRIVQRYQTSNPIESKLYAIGDTLPVSKEGVFTAVINEIERCVSPPKGDGRCTNITVAVVDTIPATARGEARRIEAFACLRILDAQHPKFVKVRMATSCLPPPSSGGIGPIFGTVTPPALVQ